MNIRDQAKKLKERIGILKDVDLVYIESRIAELEFDESKHPRDAKGSSTGGHFKSKAGAPSGLKEWFGNSKIVDKNGDPLVVYHGTDVEFDKFDPTKARKGWLGKGFYFTGDETEAAGFGKIVKPSEQITRVGDWQ